MAESKFFRGDLAAPQSLDEKGRCCGRKPLVYKREGQRFCDRCCRSYHRYQNFQIDNWAWKRREDGQFEYVTGTERIVVNKEQPKSSINIMDAAVGKGVFTLVQRGDKSYIHYNLPQGYLIFAVKNDDALAMEINNNLADDEADLFVEQHYLACEIIKLSFIPAR